LITAKGGASGGSVSTLLELLDAARRDGNVRRLLADPYALAPVRGEGPVLDGSDQLGVRWDEQLGAWTGPFVMAPINTRIVRRSNALLDYAYGPSFRYSEAMSFGKGLKGFLAASAFSTGLAFFIGAATVGPARRVLERTVLPAAGEGPSKEKREKGFYAVRLLAETEPSEGPPVLLTARVEGKRDPGYGETAMMLSESALCLALDRLASRGGVLTPASSMGMRLVERLREAGMVFGVETGHAS
jgi:short subunit dehydrogenase-like uncharacterized protein